MGKGVLHYRCVRVVDIFSERIDVWIAQYDCPIGNGLGNESGNLSETGLKPISDQTQTLLLT